MNRMNLRVFLPALLLVVSASLTAAPVTSTFTKALPGKSQSRSVVETDYDNKPRAQDTYQMVVDDGDYKTTGNGTGRMTSDATAAVPAFVFGASVVHTSGNFLELRSSANALLFSVDYAGAVTGTFAAPAALAANGANCTATQAAIGVSAAGAAEGCWSPLATASNGLTATAGDVKLGGTLTADTTITPGAFKFYMFNGTAASYESTPGQYLLLTPSPASAYDGTIVLSNVFQVDGTHKAASNLYFDGSGATLSANNYVTGGVGQYAGQVRVYNSAAGYGDGQDLIDLYGNGATKSGEFSLSINEPTASVWALQSDVFALNTPSVTIAQNTTVSGAFTLALNPTAVTINGVPAKGAYTGTTGAISAALTLGTCTSGTATVTGATTAMAVVASPVTYPGDGYTWAGYVSAAGTVTVKVCSMISGTPTSSTYNVRVIP